MIKALICSYQMANLTKQIEDCNLTEILKEGHPYQFEKIIVRCECLLKDLTLTRVLAHL
jgi:hypothetical protein